MRKHLIAFIFISIGSHAFAAPQVTNFALTVNVGLCSARSNLAHACQIAKENTQKLKAKLSTYEPTSDDFKKWSELLPMFEKNEVSICEGIAKNQNIEMATVTLLIEKPVSIERSQLDFGVLGRVTLAPRTNCRRECRASSPIRSNESVW